MAQHGKILIVDANFQVRRILCEILERAGYEPAGYSSLAHCIEAQDAEISGDLFVLDCPVHEMTINDAVGSIRNNGFEKPVLLISGMLQPDLDQEALDVHFLPKPFSGSKLLDLVQLLISNTP